MPNTKLQAILPYISEERQKKFEDALEQRSRRLCMVLENVYLSRNASAVMRSCDGMGIQDVHLIEDINPWVLNRGVSKGTPSWLTIHRYTNADDPIAACIKALRVNGYKIAVTSPHIDGYEARSLPINKPVAVVMGTEFKGVSKRMMEAADYNVVIPMRGMTESLNISVAAGIIIQRIMENIRNLPPEDWQLAPREKDAVMLDWALKSVKKSDAILKHLGL